VEVRKSVVVDRYNYYLLPRGIMTFVYTGKGRRGAQNDDASPEQKECAKQACAIQWCLAKRNHKEKFCQAYIDDWKDCCTKVQQKQHPYPQQQMEPKE
jgi:hypothetical protein